MFTLHWDCMSAGLAKPASVAAISQEPGVREALDWIRQSKSWINLRHLEVCRVPAPTFQEQARAEWMAEQFRAMGLTARIDRAGNVLAWPYGEHAGDCVALTAHLDTVLAPRLPEDVTLGPDGRFCGPGVADNGCGLAALLAIGKALSAAPPIETMEAYPVLIANVGEEGEGNLSGMRYLCRPGGAADAIRAFLILDGPATDRITSRALASRRFEISLAGPGGHSWSDFGIVNPVHALSRLITLFTDNGFAGFPSADAAGRNPRCSYNFGTLEGGLSVNSIPATARTKLDLRSEEQSALDQMSERLMTAVEKALEMENGRATGSRLTAKVREIGSRPGGGLSKDAPLLTYVRAVDTHLGIRARLDCASTDANIPLSLGLPAVAIGAGGQGGGSHTPAEWYDPEGRELGIERAFLVLCMLMRTAGSG